MKIFLFTILALYIINVLSTLYDLLCREYPIKKTTTKRYSFILFITSLAFTIWTLFLLRG